MMNEKISMNAAPEKTNWVLQRILHPDSENRALTYWYALQEVTPEGKVRTQYSGFNEKQVLSNATRHGVKDDDIKSAAPVEEAFFYAVLDQSSRPYNLNFSPKQFVGPQVSELPVLASEQSNWVLHRILHADSKNQAPTFWYALQEVTTKGKVKFQYSGFDAKQVLSVANKYGINENAIQQPAAVDEALFYGHLDQSRRPSDPRFSPEKLVQYLAFD